MNRVGTNFSDRDVVSALYGGLLNRDPDPSGLAGILEAISGGMSLATIVHNLVSSAEFRRLQARSSISFRAYKPACTLLQGRLKLWVDLSDAHVSLACLNDEYEPSETAFVLNHLQPGDGFLDIGANVGWFTIKAADRVGPTGKVHSFEPRADTRALLERSIQDNGFDDICEVHAVALGDEARHSRILWMGDTSNPGGTRLARDDQDAFDHMQSQEVEVVPLDDLGIERTIKLIKLDVEGAEAKVLMGAKALIERDRPLIMTEIFGHALRHVSNVDIPEYRAFISSIGYRILELRDGQAGAEITDNRALETSDPINCVLSPT